MDSTPRRVQIVGSALPGRFDSVVSRAWVSRSATRKPHHRQSTGAHVAASVVDAARVALLESAFVSVALHMGRQEHVNPREMAVGDVPQPPVRGAHQGSRGLLPTGGPVPSASWESLGTVNLEDVFLERVPILRSCPHFLRVDCGRVSIWLCARGTEHSWRAIQWPRTVRGSSLV